ncbi:SLAM family member 9-like [Rhinoraja longicauda]
MEGIRLSDATESHIACTFYNRRDHLNLSYLLLHVLQEDKFSTDSSICRLLCLNNNLLFGEGMARRVPGIHSLIGILWLLLSDSGGLGQTAGKPDTRRLVNGTLGQSVTIPGCISAENITVLSWDYQSSPTTGKVELCVKTQNSPIQYNKQGIRLNLKDCSLEIRNLTERDQGLYEMNLRTNLAVHVQVTELKIYERVSLPVINISAAFTGGVCNVSLVCSLEHGTEPVYTWWTGDGKVTADGSHILTDGGRRLALSIAPPNNNSVYNCTVGNPVSEETRSVNLTERCPAHEGLWLYVFTRSTLLK